MQVKGFARNNIQSVIDCRDAGAYDSLTDFLLRATIDDSEAEALIRCGAFDRFGWTRPELLWQLRLFSKRSGLLSSASQENHMPGFRACADMGDESHSLIPSLPQYDLREKLLSELECMDITVTSHLLSLYAEESASLASTAARTGIPFIPAREISQYAGRLVSMEGWLITAKRTRTSKNELMKFLTLEDATASYEVILFPGIYRRFGHVLYSRGPFNVKGRVEIDSHCCTLTALWLGQLK
jgi:DNA polymerase III alpha subunit